MLRKLLPRSIYDVMAAIGCFVALATGTAYAANTVFSTDIVDGEVKSVDIGNNEIGSGDVKDNSINTFDVHSFLGVDVVDDTLTSADIQESTLFRCHAGAVVLGRLCAGGGSAGSLATALNTCGAIGLRLPTWGEAHLLGRNQDVPGVSASQRFWTDEIVDWADQGDAPLVVAVDENGGSTLAPGESSLQIVCVETPNGLP